jgi:WD40 repeat protein
VPAALRPDGAAVAVASGKKVRLLEWPGGRVLGEWQATAYPDRLVFSPDGKTLLLVGKARSAQMMDVAGGRMRGAPLAHQEGRILAVAFSADSRLVVTGGQDGTARLWDAATGKQLGPVVAHRAEVTAVAISPDGRQVVSGAADGTLMAWAVPTAEGGTPEQIRRRVEALTGLTLDARGGVHSLGGKGGGPGKD